MPVTVSMNFMEISLKRLWNRPLNEHALRVMGGGCDGKVSPSDLLRAMSRVEWLADLSIKSSPHGFCNEALCVLRGEIFW